VQVERSTKKVSLFLLVLYFSLFIFDLVQTPNARQRQENLPLLLLNRCFHFSFAFGAGASRAKYKKIYTFRWNTTFFL